MGNLINKPTDKPPDKDDVYKFNIKAFPKLREIVKDPESGYQRHPQFGESILILKETKRVVSSDEYQWFFKDPTVGWTITEVDYGKYLTLGEYVKKYCEFKQFGEFVIPVYVDLKIN